MYKYIYIYIYIYRHICTYICTYVHGSYIHMNMYITMPGRFHIPFCNDSMKNPTRGGAPRNLTK